MNKQLFFLSWGYWFSSRTLGLLTHPYITMRVIVREHFMRPLVAAPLFFWLLSLILGVLLTRIGMFFDLGKLSLASNLSSGLVFVWLWGTIFVILWQVLLGYLYFRFRGISS